MIKIIIKQSKQIETNKNWKPKIKEKEKKKKTEKNTASRQECKIASTNFVVCKQSRIWLRIISNPFVW